MSAVNLFLKVFVQGADADDIAKHLDRVGDHAHTRVGLIDPLNRNFHHLQAELACQKEQFHIEAETIELLAGEECIGS